MKLTDKASIPGVIQSMPLEDKVKFLIGSTFFRTAAMEEYGIPEVYYLDGGTGPNLMQMVIDAAGRMNPSAEGGGSAVDSMMDGGDDDGSMQKMMGVLEGIMNPASLEGADEATKQAAAAMQQFLNEEYLPGGTLPGCFPPGILFGATWNAQTIYECGRALGKECGFFNIDVLLGTPNVNIHRDPLGGRVFEGYSEDPHLVAALAPHFVRGLQEEGVIANVKHFAANNQERNRRGVDTIVSERALYEIYFPGFKACVMEADCKTVMSAYNSINGTPCAENPWLLRDVLKKEWGFDGFVVSDWGAVIDQVAGIRGGNDVDMPGPRAKQPIIDAVKAGELDEKLIDDAVARVLGVLVEMPKEKRKQTTIDREGSRKAAYAAVQEGLILLKNERGALPLKPDAKVALYGEKSRQFLESGGGSANVVTSESTSLYDCLAERLGADAVRFSSFAADTGTMVVTVSSMGSESYDRKNMDIDAAEIEMAKDTLRQAKQKQLNTVMILNVCGPVDLREYIDDVDALICIFYPGMEGGRATADMMCGAFSPSGKLPLTFGKRYEDYGSSTSFPGWGWETRYDEDIFVGYRHFDRWNVEPLYPFGFGLSYTSFSIQNAALGAAALDVDAENDSVTLSVEVANTGAMAGKEVVQLYLGHSRPARPQPLKQLKAFEKVELAPGQRKTITFTLTKDMFASYDDNTHRWEVEPGLYHLYIGNSSRHIAQTLELRLEGFNPYGLTGESSLNDMANTPGALEALVAAAPTGLVSRESIDVTSLFSSMVSLKTFWKQSVAPHMDPAEADKAFDALVRQVNRL